MSHDVEGHTPPTVFHITHHKAGSQWVAEVLKYCVPERIVLPKIRMGQFYQESLIPGGVYLTVYVPKSDFDVVTASFHGTRRPFVVMRDLRDTLVSWYFSLRFSHITNTSLLRRARAVLNELDQEEGLLSLIEPLDVSNLSETFACFLPNTHDESVDALDRAEFLTSLSLFTWYHAYIQLSWLQAREILVVRYEDILADEHAVFERIIEYCQLDVDNTRLHEIVAHNSFKAVTGRSRGQEDVHAHQRKGIAGDWRNHFTARMKEEFKQRFGDALIRTGYEQDMNW